MSAFGGLFKTCPASGMASGMASADAAAGGGGPGDESAGGVCSQGREYVKTTGALQVPPQPSLPVRMPRRTRIFDSPSASSLSSGPASSFASSRSPVATPAGTPALLSPESLKFLHERIGTAPKTTEQSSPSWWSALPLDEAESERNAKMDLKIPHENQECMKQPPRPAPPERIKPKKLRDRIDYSDYCCFRDARSRHSPCEAIKEDQPQTIFDRDVAILELRSLLRLHHIEPTERLVGDLLLWTAGISQAAVHSNTAASSSAEHRRP